MAINLVILQNFEMKVNKLHPATVAGCTTVTLCEKNPFDTGHVFDESADAHSNKSRRKISMKKVLLAGLVAMTGAASLVAQEVTSINAVGFVNVTVPAGFSMIANQLNASANTLSQLLPSVPENTRIYKYTGSSFSIATFERDDFDNLAWNQPGLTLAPGEGAFIQNPGSPFSVTFVGEVLTGALNNSIPSGFSIRSSMVPQSGRLDGASPGLSFPVSENDRIYRYVNGVYQISTYERDDFDNLNWSVVPTPAVGESFWVFTSSSKTWSRTFSLN